VFLSKKMLKRFLYKITNFIIKSFVKELEDPFIYIPIFIAIGIGAFFKTDISLGEFSYVMFIATSVVFSSIGVLRYFFEAFSTRTCIILFASILCSIYCGYVASLVRTKLLDTKLLRENFGHPVKLDGIIEQIEVQEKSTRVYLADVKIVDNWWGEGETLPIFPKIRINLRQKLDILPIIGSKAYVRAVLMPPPNPILPNGFDFPRFAYFKGLSAIGYAVSKIHTKGEDVGVHLFIDSVRQKIGSRIKDSIPKPASVIANGILIGDAAGIGEKDFAALRVAGTAHLIAISGMHIAVVAGLIFFVTRFLLSRLPSISLKWNIKKIAAIVAICFSFAYLLISGSPVSALRAFFMSGLVLLAILIDRHPQALRGLTITTIIILIFTPEMLFSPSLQMSLAACLALITGFNTSYKKLNLRFANRLLKKSKILHIIANALKYIGSITYASIVAGLATAPFIIYHFNQFSIYSVLANLISVPLSDFIIMPIGMISILLMPLHMEYPLLVVMRYGIDCMLWISRFISELPNAALYIPSFSDSGIVAIALAQILWCLLRTRLRYIAAVLSIYGCTTIWRYASPDIIISGNAKLFAVSTRGLESGSPTKSFVLSSIQKERYAQKAWRQTLKPDSFAEKALDRYIIPNCSQAFCQWELYGKKAIIYADRGRHYPEICDLIDSNAEQREIDVFVNMINDIKCQNAKINVTSSDLAKNGTYTLRLDSRREWQIDRVLDHLSSGRPWVSQSVD